MTSADLLGDAQCITSSIDNCRLSVVESPTCRRRKSHHINGNALVATKSFGWRQIRRWPHPRSAFNACRAMGQSRRCCT